MKRTLAIILSLLLVLSLFAGCRDSKRTKKDDEPEKKELTASEVIKAAEEKMKTVKSLNMDLNLDAKINMAAEGTTINAAANADFTGGMHTDPLDFHLAGSVKLDAEEMGASEEIALDVIGITEDGKLAVYGWTDEDDEYTRDEIDLSEVKIDTEQYLNSLQNLDWQMETNDAGYVLSRTLTKEDSEKLFDEAMKVVKENAEELEIPDEVNEFKDILEGVKLAVTVQKDTMYITGVDVDMTSLFSGALPQLIAGFALAGGGDEMPEIDFTGSALTLSLKCRDFDAVPEIKAPENYTDSSDWEDWDDGDDDDDDDWDWDLGYLDAIDLNLTLGEMNLDVAEITVRDLLSAGWEIEEAYETENYGDFEDVGEMLAPGARGVIELIPAGWEGEETPLEISVSNQTDAEVSYLDCPVCTLEINDNMLLWGEYDHVQEFVTGYGVGYGDNIQDAIAALGEPYMTMEAQNENDYGMYDWVTEDYICLELSTDYDGVIRAVHYLIQDRVPDNQ